MLGVFVTTRVSSSRVRSPAVWRCDFDSRQLKIRYDTRCARKPTRVSFIYRTERPSPAENLNAERVQSNRPIHTRHDTDKTVLSCLAGGVNWSLDTFVARTGASRLEHIRQTDRQTDLAVHLRSLTGIDGCEQLALGRQLTAERAGIHGATAESRKSNALTAAMSTMSRYHIVCCGYPCYSPQLSVRLQRRCR